jgi:hypothetical protein
VIFRRASCSGAWKSVDRSLRTARSPPLRRQVLSPDSPTWCSAQSACHGSRLRAKRGGPVPRHPLAPLRLDGLLEGLSHDRRGKPVVTDRRAGTEAVGDRGRGRPARRAGASPVTSAFGAEDGWGCPRAGPAAGVEAIARAKECSRVDRELKVHPPFRSLELGSAQNFRVHSFGHRSTTTFSCVKNSNASRPWPCRSPKKLSRAPLKGK